MGPLSSRVLAFVAAAGEPVGPEIIAQWLGLPDGEDVRRWCPSAGFAPSHAVEGAGTPGSKWHVRLGHALRHVLNEKRATEVTLAHGRIADHYLTRWGGLAAGLPLLVAEPALGDADSGYGLRHLVRHLLGAGRTEDVRRLLACEQPAGSGRPGVVNVWFDARDRVGETDEYLRDLEVAHRLAREATDADVAAGRPARSLGLELRYTLMAICAASAGRRERGNLAVMLTEAGLWDSTRALTDARRHKRGAQRGRALLALLPHLSDEQRPMVLHEAMVEVITGDDPHDLLNEVAPFLPVDQWPRVLAFVAQQPDHHESTRLLAELAPHLPAETLGQALAIASAYPPDIYRCMAMEALAPHLPAKLAADALSATKELSEPEDRAGTLTALIPGLPGELVAAVLVEARAAIREIDPPIRYEMPIRRRAWTRLIPLLPAAQRPAALAEAALDEEPEAHAELLTEVAEQLPIEEREPLLDEARMVAHGISNPVDRAQALIKIADLLPPKQAPALADALAVTRTIAEPYERVRTLSSLIKRLPAPERAALLHEALAAARGLTDDDDRAEMLIELAEMLPPDEQQAPLAEAVHAARAVEHEDRRFRLFFDAAGLLSGADRRAALAEALEVRLEYAHYENFFAYQVLDELAPVLPEDLMTEVLDTIEAVGRPGYLARVLCRRAEYLSGAALEAGLTAARGLITRPGQSAAALSALSDQLPTPQRLDVLEEALTVAREAQGDMTFIARRLPEERRTALLVEQLTFPRNAFRQTREEALAALVPHVSADEWPPGTPFAAPGQSHVVRFDYAPVHIGQGRNEAAHAYLIRAQRARARGANTATVLGLIRDALKRYDTLDAPGSPALAGAARDLGGPQAIRDYLKAVLDIYRWWP